MGEKTATARRGRSREVIMNKSERAQNTGIVFGDWKLIPIDGCNWELAHRHANTRGDNAGRVQWNRLGRYYQSNTFHLALRHAADQELADECESAAIPIEDALRDYERIVTTMTDALKTALEARQTS